LRLHLRVQARAGIRRQDVKRRRSQSLADRPIHRAFVVHSEYFDPGDIGCDMGEGAIITLEFSEDKGITTLTTLMDFGNKRARDAVATGMTDGMEQSYQLLDGVLAKP
jgi:hypothetical protein